MMKITAFFLGLLGLLVSLGSLLAADLTGDNLIIGTENDISNPTTQAGLNAAIGLGNVVELGSENLLIGENNDMSSASVSLIVGNGNYGNSDTILSVGYVNNLDGGANSAVFGSYNYASINNGLIAGLNNSVEGDMQFAFGHGLINHATTTGPAFYVGQYNLSVSGSNPPLFVIGNGTGDGTNGTHRSNALEVYLDGKVKINNELELDAPSYNSTNPDLGKIVVRPSTSGSSITVDGQPVLTSSNDGSTSFGGGAAWINGDGVLNGSGAEFGRTSTTNGFWLYPGYIPGDSVAGVNTTDGSASFANGNATIDSNGYLNVNGISVASNEPAGLNFIAGFILKSADDNTLSIDYSSRTLYDTDGATSVMSWGQGNGSVTFADGNASIDASGYVNGNGFNSTATSYLDAISGLNILSQKDNEIAIDLYNRRLHDTNGTTTVLSWGHGNGSATFSGNVGIGTESPAAKLDVNGAARIAGNADFFASNYNLVNVNSGKISIRPSTTGSSIIVDGQPLVLANSATVQSFTAPSYSFNSGGTNRLTIDSNGSIGVGTGYPAANIDFRINSNTASNNAAVFRIVDPAFPTNAANSTQYALGQIQFSPLLSQTPVLALGRRTTGSSPSNDGTVLGTLLFNGSGTDAATFRKGAELSAIARASGWGNTTWPTDLAFLVNGGTETTALSERMRITSSGNVGIGTSAPANRLDVSGNTSISGNLGMGNSSPSAKVDINQSANTLPGLNVVNSNGSPSGSVAVFQRSNNIAGSPITSPALALVKIKEGGGVPFYVTDKDEVYPYFVILPNITTGAGQPKGYVGIGTSTPTTKLDVNGGAKFADTVEIYASNYNSANANIGKISIQSSITGSTISIDGQSLVTATSTTAQTFSAPTYSFNSGGANRLTINSSGNIGIGTASPQATLDVNGRANFSDAVTITGDTTNTALSLKKSGLDVGLDIMFSDEDLNAGYGDAGVAALGVVAGDPGNIYMKYGSDTEWGKLVHEDVDGNVGIGTTTPQSKLEIAASAAPYAASPPSSSAVLGRSIVDWHYEQGNYDVKYYIKLADVSPNNGSVQIEGLIGGHTFGDGKAAINLLVSERDNPVRTATVMGSLGPMDIQVFKHADNSSSIYLVTAWWSEVTLRMVASATSNGTTLYPNPTKSITVPTGTMAYSLSQDAQYHFGYDGKMKIAKQGDILMGEFGNGND